MDFQTITHTEPTNPPGIAIEIPGNGKYRVSLGTGSLRGDCDGRRVTVTANFDIEYVFRCFKIVVGRLVGKTGEGWVCLASKYY